MRAVVCHEFGPYEDLEVEDIPAPEPPEDGVVIDVHAAGVSFATNLVVAGKYQRRPPRPFSPGTEIAGIVRQLADGVDRVAVGDRVFAGVDWGGQAGQCATHSVYVHKLPEGMSFAQGTLMGLSYPTAYGALVWRAQLQPGETALIHGATGAIGLAAVEIAKAKGARVIAVAGGEEKTAVAREHGADEVIDHQSENFRDRVLDMTDGAGADVIYDSIGGEVAKQSLRCITESGRLLTLGYASGEIPALPANMFLLKNISWVGFNYGTYLGWGPKQDRHKHAALIDEMQTDLTAMFAAGQIAPRIGARYPLDEFKEALDAVLARRVIGKCVIEIDDADR